jgi:hypothetical protein
MRVRGAALMVCCTIHQGSTYLAILRILQKLRIAPFLLHNLKPTFRKGAAQDGIAYVTEVRIYQPNRLFLEAFSANVLFTNLTMKRILFTGHSRIRR